MSLSFRIGGVLLSRLLLFLLVVFIPLYFLLLFILSPVKLLPYPFSDIVIFNYPVLHVFLQSFEAENPWMVTVNYFLIPLFFSLPWFLFIVLSRERLLKTFEVLDNTTTIVPLRYRIFYGFNTLLLFCFFVLPTLSPVLSILAGVILAGRALNTSRWFWRQGRVVRGITALTVFTLICGIPVYLAALYYLEGIHVFFANWLWDSWVNNMVVTYTLSMCIVDALALGSVIWLIFAGAAEFEAKTFGVAITKPPYRAIALFEAAAFLLLAYVGLPYIYIPGWPPYYVVWGSNPRFLYDYVNYVCLGIISLVTLICMVRGVRRGRGVNPSLIGLLIAGGFLGVDMVTGGQLRTLAILPKILTPVVLGFLASKPSLIFTMANIGYILNVYIPYYELPRVMLCVYWGTGMKAAFALAVYLIKQIKELTIYSSLAVVVTAILWILTFTYCFARAGRRDMRMWNTGIT